jgi:hypothetical protein
MLVQKVFVREGGCAVYAHFSRAVVIDKVCESLRTLNQYKQSHPKSPIVGGVLRTSTLNHEAFNDAMKDTVLVAGRLFVLQEFSGAKLSKVLACFRTILLKKFDFDPSQRRLVVA